MQSNLKTKYREIRLEAVLMMVRETCKVLHWTGWRNEIVKCTYSCPSVICCTWGYWTLGKYLLQIWPEWVERHTCLFFKKTIKYVSDQSLRHILYKKKF